MKSGFLKKYGFFLSFLPILLVWTSVDLLAQQDSNQNGTQKSAISKEIAVAQDAVEDFVYSLKGRRDPFKPLVQKKPEISNVKGRLEKIKGPLEKIELSQFRLMAIMVVNGVPRAMVEAPDGKGYSVKVGEYIGMKEGIVKNIETKVVEIDENGLRIEKSPDRIVVEEVGINSYTGKEVKKNRYIVM